MGEVIEDLNKTLIDEAQVDADWHARGFTCERRSDPPGQAWTDYAHDADKLIMAIEGDIVVEMKGEIFELKPGEEILIPAHVVHTIRNVGSSPSDWLRGMSMDYAYTD
ncbi:MAG: cupin domain-containing protein [Candidatus Hydrogenedentales bacterium]|jgi:mannose-6-phosphate isomerase-like protein (cupin superfamily)